MAASITVGFQIFKLQLLYLLVDFDQTCIKIFGLNGSVPIDILSFRIAFPFMSYQDDKG